MEPQSGRRKDGNRTSRDAEMIRPDLYSLQRIKEPRSSEKCKRYHALSVMVETSKAIGYANKINNNETSYHE